MDYRIEALTSDHLSVAQFDCGHENSLGRWLEDKALGYQKEHLCRVHVMIDEKDSERLCGFFTLSAHQIITKGIVKKDRRDDSKNGSIAGSLEGHPSLLLGKFALDRDYQGKGVSSVLMHFVYQTFLASLQYSGARYLVAEVREDALRKVYRNKFKFALSPSAGKNGKKIYYKKTADICEEVRRVDAALRSERPD